MSTFQSFYTISSASASSIKCQVASLHLRWPMAARRWQPALQFASPFLISRRSPGAWRDAMVRSRLSCLLLDGKYPSSLCESAGTHHQSIWRIISLFGDPRLVGCVRLYATRRAPSSLAPWQPRWKFQSMFQFHHRKTVNQFDFDIISPQIRQGGREEARASVNGDNA